MLNKVILQGRLVADPDLRHTGNGTAVTTFRIAVDRDYKNKTTGGKDTDFINCVAWRGTAEFVSQYFYKGRMIVVEGRLQMRNYTDKDSNKRVASEVLANSVYFCDSKRDNGNDSYGAPPANFGARVDGAPGNNGFAELEDDDGELPF